jgi:general stress protein 26
MTFNDPRIQRYLATKDIVVLGTINPDGSPLVTAMWFLHDPAALTLISVDDLQKVRNLRRDPRLHIVAESGARVPPRSRASRSAAALSSRRFS